MKKITVGVLFFFLVAFPFTGMANEVEEPFEQPLLPFEWTGDLYVLDDGSGSVLKIDPETGAVFVEISKSEIKDVTEEYSVSFKNCGIAFDCNTGAMFFTENRSDSILKYVGEVLTTLVSKSDMRDQIVSEKFGWGWISPQPRAIAFGSDGYLYVGEENTDSVLMVHPDTGDVSVYVTRGELDDALDWWLMYPDLEGGIVGGLSGFIYVTSAGWPDVIYAIAPPETEGDDPLPSVLDTDNVFEGLDVFMTRAPNGDLIVSDNRSHWWWETDAIFRVALDDVDSVGDIDVFLTRDELRDVAGESADLQGGIAFDGDGNFYVAEENTDSILIFPSVDPATGSIDPGDGQVLVDESDILFATKKSYSYGERVDLEGGIAFSPLDSDEDGPGDACDNCPDKENADQADTDEDGLGDECDNCRFCENPDQEDLDENGIGDACQGDLDQDCDVDKDDLNLMLSCLNQPATCAEQGDLNGDGMITVLDLRQLIRENPLLARDRRLRRLLR